MRAAASRCLAASCRTPAAGIRRNQNGASARRGAYGLRVARARRGSPVARYAPRALVDLQRPTCVEFRPNSVKEIHSTPFANEKYIPHHSSMIKYRMSKIKYEKPFSRLPQRGSDGPIADHGDDLRRPPIPATEQTRGRGAKDAAGTSRLALCDELTASPSVWRVTDVATSGACK